MNISVNSIPMNLYAFNINQANIENSTTKNASLDLQNCIKENNPTLVDTILTEGVSLNDPLPNGQLPIHFATLENKPEMVSALLTHSANPELKDSQGLSAMDHAVLMNNKTILAQLISHKIGGDLKDIQEQINIPGAILHHTILKEKINQISKIPTEKLNAISNAAYKGNIEELTNLVTEKTVNNFDEKGLAPIHYAILGNRLETVQKLIAMGSKIDMVTPSNITLTQAKGLDTLLHFAAINGSKEVLNYLIGLGIDINYKNVHGETALHYLAVKENLADMELLIKAGADPRLCSKQNISPLGLIGLSAHERDPLALTQVQSSLFTSTSLLLASATAINSGWLTSENGYKNAL